MEKVALIRRVARALFTTLAAITSLTCWVLTGLAVFVTNAITLCPTKAQAACVATRRVLRVILVAAAITQTSATPSSSEFSGLSEVARLKSLVETEGACSLPGCTIKYGSFIQVMWSAVQRGFVRHDEATFVADGLRNGFKLGVDTSKMRGHRQFNNYKSSIEAAASVSRAVQERVRRHS